MEHPEFIDPNLHVVLVHYPLALLIAGVLIELFSFLWRRSSLRTAGRWMILLGALSSIPTTLSGVYALHDVAGRGLESTVAGGPWKEVSSHSLLSEHQWEMLHDHARLQIASTVLAVLVVVTWIGCSDRARLKLHWLLMLILLISVAMTVSGAWHGGELVYAHGTGVSLDKNLHVHEHPATSEPATTVASTAVATTPSVAETHIPPGANVNYFLPPVQMHVISAGTTIAIALAALGLSIRKISQGIPTTQVDHIAAALGSDAPDSLASEPQDVGSPRVPASRFWMLAFFVALLTAGGGYWLVAQRIHSLSFNDVWKGEITANMHNQDYRQIAHVIGGGSIAVLALILAMLARIGPRQKFLLFFFALLLVGVVTAQVWFGVLMLYDTRLGPLTRFN